MQVDIALQFYGTCQPYTLGHDEPSASLALQSGYGPGEGIGTECQPVAHSSEVCKADATVGDLRSGYLFHIDGQVGIVAGIVFRKCAGC